MSEFKLAYMAHGKDAGAQDRHGLFGCEGPFRFDSVIYLVVETVRLVLEELNYFVLFGTDVDLGKDFVVMGVEVELVGQRECPFILFYVFFE